MLNIKIPNELSFHSILPEDVNILVGENGCGKSYLLSQLAEVYLNGSYSKVIAIANSIHDKFNSRGPRFHPLRARQGRRQTKEILKRTFHNISRDEKKLSYISRALKYVDYNPVIGVKLTLKEDVDFEYKIENSQLYKSEKEDLVSLLRKYKSLRENENVSTNRNQIESPIIWAKMEKYDFGELERLSIIEIFTWESTLYKLGIINPIEVFLSKGNFIIPLLNASSGELSLITSIIYISSVIDDNTVILVDEPENSLHPKWQREYVKTLMDIFYRYQPRLVLATHSPLIISGSLMTINKTKVYKGLHFEFLSSKY